MNRSPDTGRPRLTLVTSAGAPAASAPAPRHVRELMSLALEGKPVELDDITALSRDDLQELCVFLSALNVLRTTTVKRLERAIDPSSDPAMDPVAACAQERKSPR